MAYSRGNLSAHIHWVLSKPGLPGWTDIRRTLSGHTFYYIHSGKGFFGQDGSEVQVEGGTLAYMWPGLALAMRSSELQPLRMTMMLFDCAELSMEDGLWKGPVPVDRLELPFLMPLSAKRAEEISRLFLEGEVLWVPGDPRKEGLVQSLWHRLIQELHDAAEAGPEPEEAGLQAALQRVKEHMDRHYQTELRIMALSEQYGLSPAYLRRCFAVRYGCGPKEYLDRLRNGHAVRRLRYTADSISAIAKACGYPDVYQFSKAFRKRNGVSPSDYRSALAPP